MEYGAAVLLLALVVAVVVSGPLRPGRAAPATADPRRQELEAAREAKYRELRDHELDFRTGKISEGDFEQGDREMRREALGILRELDELTPERPG